MLSSLQGADDADIGYHDIHYDDGRMIADTVTEGAGRKILVEKSTVPVNNDF